MAWINATFIRGDRRMFDRVIDWDGQPEWSVPVPVKFSMNEEPRDPTRCVVPVEVYKHLGELPNKVHLFGQQKAGIVSWHTDQYFRGPDRNNMLGWQRVLKGADKELHMWMTHLAGCPTWPNKPEHPPFITLFSEMRFLTDACETHQKPYMFMYHRRSQGVAVKRVM